jgi:hypothetical protein
MRIRMRNIRVFRISNDACRFECEIGADQQKPLLSFLEKLRGFDISAELSKWVKKRSTDANAYAWKILSLIADELTASHSAVTKDDMYIDMLKKYGQGGLVKVRPGDSESILREFPYYEKHEKIYNDENQYYRVWVGSSNYNSHEMYIFIEGIIAEARDLGIETLPPDEVKRLTDSYRPKRTGGDD